MAYLKKYWKIFGAAAVLLLTGFGIILAGGTLFKVISASPQGALTAPPDALEIRFSKPLIGLQSVKSMENLPVKKFLRIDPPLLGKLQYKSQDALRFKIDKRSLQPNTRYRVWIKKGIKALDGSKLSRSFYFDFDNRRFTMLGAGVNDEERDMSTRPRLLLFFNQPLNVASAAKGITLRNTDSDERVPVGVIRYKKKQRYIRNRYISWSEYRKFRYGKRNMYVYQVVTPLLQRNSSYTLRVDATVLRAAAGALSLRRGQDITFHTVRPLTADLHMSDPLRPNGYVRVDFRYGLGMSKQDLQKYITVTDDEGKKVKVNRVSYYKGSRYCYLWPDFQPRSDYRIKVRAGVKDKYGQKLASSFSQTVQVGDYAPNLDIPFPSDTMVESYGKIHHLPMSFVNLRSLKATIMVYHSPEDYLKDNPARTESKDFADNITKVNKQYVFRLQLGHYLRNKRGIVKVRIDYVTREDERSHTQNYLLQFSGLAMTVKYSPKNLFVHTTRLQDGKPAGGIAVEVWDKEENKLLLQGKTDAKGNLLRSLDNSELGKIYSRYDYRSRVVFFARQGDDFCKLDGDSGSKLSLYNAGISYYNTGSQIDKYLAHLFTPKGIYKKGEKVVIKGYVRENRAGKLTVPANREFDLSVYDAAGNSVVDKKIKVSAWGSFSEEYQLPADPKLGRYRIRLKSAESDEDSRYSMSSRYGSFLVEAFRPREFEATVRAGRSGQHYFPKSRIPVQIKGQYFYGGLMAGGRLKYRVTATPYHFNPSDSRYDGYGFSSNRWLAGGNKPEWKTVKSSKQISYKSGLKLNQKGEKRFQLTGSSPFYSSALFKVAAEVTDEKRQSIAESDSVVVHQGRYYIGAKLSESFLSTSDTLQVRLTALRPNGKPAGRRLVTARLYRVEWKNVRKLSSDGTWRWNTGIRYVPVKTFRVRTAYGVPRRAQLRYRPAKAGRYIWTFSSKDRHGNRITNTAMFWVWGGFASWKMSDDQVVELVKDKGDYRPGDTAKIMVKSPYKKVRALVTVEREGVIDSFVTELNGSADIVRIPVKPSYQPNVFVSVVLLQGRINNKFPMSKLKDIYRPTVKVGYALLPVSSKHKKLKIDINKNKKEYKPGDKVRVKLRVKDYRGRPLKSEVALFVVDEGVLSLIGYKTPNPSALFHSQRELLVRTYDNRLHILGQHMYKLKGETPGGGGAAMSPRNGSDGLSSINARKVFKSIAFSKTAIITGSDGRATVSFKLPDNLTRFRIMAVAVDRGDRFGSAQQPLRVTKKLIIKPALPRFTNLGDSLSAGLVVDNNSAKAGWVRVYAKVKGGIKMEGKSVARIRLNARQSKEVRFKMDAVKADEGEFDFTAVMQRDDGKRFTDRLQWKIPVQIPRIRLTTAKSAHLDGSKRNEQVMLPQNIWPGSGEIHLQAASTALVHLDGAVRYLYKYPYGCLEQRVSRILPMVLAEDLVKAFKLPIKQDYRKWVQKLLDRLPLYQDKSSGGFYYWPERRYRHRPSPYLSIQTYYLLQLARKQGYRINEKVYLAAGIYVKEAMTLSESAKRYYPFHSGYWSAVDIKAFSLLVETGSADRSYVHTLYQNALNQPVYIQAVLAKALHKLDADLYQSLYYRLLGRMRSAIKYEGRYAWVNENGGNWSWYRHLYCSDGKATAAVLEALIAIRPKDTLIPKLVAGLMRSRKQGHWRTTQENQFVFRALNAYFKRYEKVTPDFTALFQSGSRTLFRSVFKGRSLKTDRKTVGFNRLPGRGRKKVIAVRKQGDGRLYYSLEMSYLPRKMPGAIDRGFEVSRTVYDKSGKRKITGNVYRAGEMYKVELKIKTQTGRYYVVVDDPLPAGFEAVNPRLKSVSIDGGGTAQQSNRWWYGFNRTAMKDDRVCLFASYLPEGTYRFSYFVKATTMGEFFKAPVKAEEMYYPEIFGTGKAGRITVR